MELEALVICYYCGELLWLVVVWMCWAGRIFWVGLECCVDSVWLLNGVFVVEVWLILLVDRFGVRSGICMSLCGGQQLGWELLILF